MFAATARAAVEEFATPPNPATTANRTARARRCVLIGDSFSAIVSSTFAKKSGCLTGFFVTRIRLTNIDNSSEWELASCWQPLSFSTMRTREEHEEPEPHERHSFSIMTTAANDFMSTIHDRTPVILDLALLIFILEIRESRRIESDDDCDQLNKLPNWGLCARVELYSQSKLSDYR